MITTDKIYFIDVDGGRKWEVWVSQLPIFLNPHRSSTQLECIAYLEEEVIGLLDAIKAKKKEVSESIGTKIKLWAIDVCVIDGEMVIKQREITYVKCNIKYKVYGDWGYRGDKWYYANSIPNGWIKKVDEGCIIHRKITPIKMNESRIRKEFLQLK